MKRNEGAYGVMEANPGCITITAPGGAVCGLYPNVPDTTDYFKGIHPENAIKPAEIYDREDRITYRYTQLPEGLYHYGVSRDGYTAVCQIVDFDGRTDMQLDVELSPLAGNGYERGFIMLNTQAFMDKCLTSHKNAWGGEYVHLFATPQFARPQNRPGKHQQTTNEELWEFIRRLEASADYMYIFSLGNSPKYKYPMPLVLFTQENIRGMRLEQAARLIRSNGKPTVQYTAQVHSNEPGSTEGALAMMLDLVSEKGRSLLDAIDVYIIPRINLDGAVEVVRKSPTTEEDMNRDYLYMNNQEIQMVTGAYNLFLPELAVDGHEKRSDVLTTLTSRCTDMELQVGAGSLNHPAVMTQMAMDIALTAIARGRELGLRSHFYGNLASAAGGCAGSSYYGTRNSLSFLVETPGGTTLGSCCMERRVMAQYTLASTVMRYAAEHSREVMATVHASRKEMADLGGVYDPSRLIVLEHGKEQTGSLCAPMIHVPSGEVTEPACEIGYNEQTIARKTRIRPTAYVIPMGLPGEKEILRVTENHAIPYDILPADSVVKLQRYMQKDLQMEMSVEYPVHFDHGAYVFCNTVPSTVLSVIMEPDFNSSSGRKMTLFSMGLVHPDENGSLPIYRFCHDLVNGKVPFSME